MFNVGDWVWCITSIGEVYNARFFAEVGDYVFCQNFGYDDDFDKNLDKMYRWTLDNDGETHDLLMVKKENTFATEQEAREVLEAIK